MIPTPELKAALKISETDTSKDVQIAALERAAVAFVEQQTGRYFGPPEEVTEYITGSGTNTLYLPETPIDGEEIVINERSYAGATATLLAALDEGTGYLVRGTRLLRRTGGVWSSGYEFEVTYTRGYSGDEPADIRGLVLDLVVLKYKTPGGFKSESISGYSYTLADLADTPTLNKTLASWRRVRV